MACKRNSKVHTCTSRKKNPWKFISFSKIMHPGYKILRAVNSSSWPDFGLVNFERFKFGEKNNYFQVLPKFYFFLSKSECLILNRNPDHNIMKLFDILPNFSFITSEMVYMSCLISWWTALRTGIRVLVPIPPAKMKIMSIL